MLSEVVTVEPLRNYTGEPGVVQTLRVFLPAGRSWVAWALNVHDPVEEAVVLFDGTPLTKTARYDLVYGYTDWFSFDVEEAGFHVLSLRLTPYRSAQPIDIHDRSITVSDEEPRSRWL